MKNVSESSQNGQGPDSDVVAPVEYDVPTVEKWLVRDIGGMITLMNAIYNDPNIRRMMAEYLVGVNRNRQVHPAADLGKGLKVPS